MARTSIIVAPMQLIQHVGEILDLMRENEHYFGADLHHRLPAPTAIYDGSLPERNIRGRSGMPKIDIRPYVCHSRANGYLSGARVKQRRLQQTRRLLLLDQLAGFAIFGKTSSSSLGDDFRNAISCPKKLPRNQTADPLPAFTFWPK